MDRPGFNIFVGPDPVLLTESLEESVRDFPLPESGSESSGGWERQVFWGDGLNDAFWEKLTLQGLFSRPRIVLLRQAQSLPADDLKKISEILGRVDHDIWPFICFEVPFEKGRAKIPVAVSKLKCVEFAKKRGWLKEIPPLEQRSLPGFVKKEAERLSLKLSPEQLKEICASLPLDAGAARSELDKLSLAAVDGRLDGKAMKELSYSREIDVFALIRELQGGSSPEKVWRQYFKEQIGQTDAGLFSFIAMLLREGRQMWQLLAGETVFLPEAVRREKEDLAGKMGYGGLSRLWDLALRADKGVKTGEHSPEQAREKLLADLFILFKLKVKTL